jgi:hypothetical protein
MYLEGTPSTSCLCRESYYAHCSYFEKTHLCCLLRLDKDDTDLGMVENELNSVLTCNSVDSALLKLYSKNDWKLSRSQEGFASCLLLIKGAPQSSRLLFVSLGVQS